MSWIARLKCKLYGHTRTKQTTRYANGRILETHCQRCGNPLTYAVHPYHRRKPIATGQGAAPERYHRQLDETRQLTLEVNES